MAIYSAYPVSVLLLYYAEAYIERNNLYTTNANNPTMRSTAVSFISMSGRPWHCHGASWQWHGSSHGTTACYGTAMKAHVNSTTIIMEAHHGIIRTTWQRHGMYHGTAISHHSNTLPLLKVRARFGPRSAMARRWQSPGTAMGHFHASNIHVFMARR